MILRKTLHTLPQLVDFTEHNEITKECEFGFCVCILELHNLLVTLHMQAMYKLKRLIEVRVKKTAEEIGRWFQTVSFDILHVIEPHGTETLTIYQIQVKKLQTYMMRHLRQIKLYLMARQSHKH